MNLNQYDTTFHPDKIDPTAFIAQGAIIVGDVTIGEEASVWFYSTLRGDDTQLTIGAQTNIQEGCIFHADPGFPTTVGNGVTVGHGAVVHGATVGDNCLIGIRSVLLNGATIGENSIVGAGSLVPQGKVFPPGSLLLGTPAKVARSLTADDIEHIRLSAAIYVRRSREFMASGQWDRE